MARKKRRMTAVIAVIAIIAILAAVLSGRNTVTAEERFEDMRSSSNVASTNGAAVLELRAVALLAEEGIDVEDAYVSAYFVDNVPFINFTALVIEDGEKMIKSYSVQTDYDGPITSAFYCSSDSISVYGNILHIDDYFETANYVLQGEEIVVTE